MTTQLIKALEEDNERLGGSRKTPNVRAKRLKKRKSNAFIKFSSIFRQTFVETLKKAQVQSICKYEVLILK